MEQPRRLFKCSRKNFRCQKYVKKGYIEMTKKIYLDPQKVSWVAPFYTTDRNSLEIQNLFR